jgi:hypothetical protein
VPALGEILHDSVNQLVRAAEAGGRIACWLECRMFMGGELSRMMWMCRLKYGQFYVIRIRLARAVFSITPFLKRRLLQDSDETTNQIGSVQVQPHPQLRE